MSEIKKSLIKTVDIRFSTWYSIDIPKQKERLNMIYDLDTLTGVYHSMDNAESKYCTEKGVKHFLERQDEAQKLYEKNLKVMSKNDAVLATNEVLAVMDNELAESLTVLPKEKVDNGMNVNTVVELGFTEGKLVVNHVPTIIVDGEAYIKYAYVSCLLRSRNVGTELYEDLTGEYEGNIVPFSVIEKIGHNMMFTSTVSTIRTRAYVESTYEQVKEENGGKAKRILAFTLPEVVGEVIPGIPVFNTTLVYMTAKGIKGTIENIEFVLPDLDMEAEHVEDEEADMIVFYMEDGSRMDCFTDPYEVTLMIKDNLDPLTSEVLDQLVGLADKAKQSFLDDGEEYDNTFSRASDLAVVIDILEKNSKGEQ